MRATVGRVAVGRMFCWMPQLTLDASLPTAPYSPPPQKKPALSLNGPSQSFPTPPTSGTHPPGSSGTAASCVSTQTMPRSCSAGGSGPASRLERRRTPAQGAASGGDASVCVAYGSREPVLPCLSGEGSTPFPWRTGHSSVLCSDWRRGRMQARAAALAGTCSTGHSGLQVHAKTLACVQKDRGSVAVQHAAAQARLRGGGSTGWLGEGTDLGVASG
jgi:hypothetical protein